MADAEVKLAAALAGGGGDQFDVENVSGDQRVIEMDIAMVQDRSGSSSPEIRLSGAAPISPSPAWTSDSEPDSTPSPSENSYTSDTDISSSSTCSSSSCEESSPSRKAAPPSSRKRPLIEELNPMEDQSQCKTNQPKTPRQS